MTKILLVENDVQLATNLIDFLQSEHFEVTHATGQKRALEIFHAQTFDAALLDISLDDGNGFSVCAAIKGEQNLPVIFLTASGDESCTVAGFDVGADDYISKPFRPRELIARIKNAIRRTTPQSNQIVCQSLRMDIGRGTVTKNGEELFLSALEYKLLLIFLSNKEKLLTRDTLIDELWSASGEFVTDNTLTVYIKRLREKIEDDPAQPTIIKTIRGLGYKAVDTK